MENTSQEPLSRKHQKDLILKEEIIIPAWELVTHESLIKKFNFIPSLLSTIYLGFIILYQIAFSYVYIFQLKDQFFALIIDFVHKSYFWEILVIIGCMLVLYIFITPIAEIGLIALIDKKTNDREWVHGIGYGISQWFIHFLPVFELSSSMALFKLLSIITFYLFLLRIFGQDYLLPISVGMFIYLIFAFLVNILFAYARFFIVFEHKKAFEAISLSVRMALHNLDITFHLYFTLLLVYIRTFLTALAFMVFPFIISALLTYITINILQIISITVITLLFLAFLVFVSHLNSVLEIFVEAIWYNAYRKNKQDSDS